MSHHKPSFRLSRLDAKLPYTIVCGSGVEAWQPDRKWLVAT
jgi:hypothetical protein